MNRGPLLFLGIFFALAVSWLGLVVGPQIQLGRQGEVSAGPALPRYPLPRSGVAREGREIYRANGCYYCHTLQVRQTGAHFNVVLAGAGTNPPAMVQAVMKVNPSLAAADAGKLVESVPKPVLHGLNFREAETAAKRLSLPEAKVNVVLVPTGPDIARGWGKRSSVAQDYLNEQPVMLGNLRLGPDLANIGERQTNAVWHYLHLFDPRLVANGSTMPRYPFLFEKRKAGTKPSSDALTLPARYVEPGYEIVPRPSARSLVAYLLSLQADAPLFEAPRPPEPNAPEPAPGTNQPPAGANPSATGPATNAATAPSNPAK